MIVSNDASRSTEFPRPSYAPRRDLSISGNPNLVMANLIESIVGRFMNGPSGTLCFAK
jgi:hypothetical protein